MRIKLRDTPSQADLDREAYDKAWREQMLASFGPYPVDPDERRIWKNARFAYAYGVGPKRMEHLMKEWDTAMQNLRRRSRRRYIAKIVATIVLITAALVLLAWHLGSTS